MSFLKAQKIELTKVYPAGVELFLQLGCDLDIGGERIRVDVNSIPHENRELFVRAAGTLSLRLAGIDYISPDILKSYTLLPTAINEINSAPDLDVHLRDSYPNQNYAAERALEILFAQKFVPVKKTEIEPVPLLVPSVSIPTEIVQLN